MNALIMALICTVFFVAVVLVVHVIKRKFDDDRG